ncbi:MAG TPA: hypothetical protein VH594_10630 [Trebonia sp.]|jgi:hypothetical protein
MSAVLIWIICVVAVVSLAIWLVAVARADRNPSFRHPRVEPRRGQVQGGTHMGGGRSLAPHRDAEITPDENPEEPTVPVRRTRGTSPMDL